MTRRRTYVLAALAAISTGCGKKAPESSAEAANPAVPGSAGGTPAAMNKPAKEPVKAVPRGPEHSVYSLVDSRLSAHLIRGGGLLVPAGSAGFAKYTRFGNLMGSGKRTWEMRQTEGEIKVARLSPKSKSGTVFVPLTAKQAARGTLRIRAFTTKSGALSVGVNEKERINGQLAEGWSTTELKIPDGQFVEGENAITMFAGAGTEIAWVQVGSEQPVGDDGAVKFYNTGTKALVIPKDGGMSWFAAIPDKAKLTADLTDGSCTLDVLVTGEDGNSVDGKLEGTGSAIDLGALSGKAARIDLIASGCPEAQITKADLVVPGAAPEVKRGEPPKHIVFIIMDSLRADRIKVFNPKARPDVPNWEKLAESSTVFLHNYVQGNESQVSHASMWTSAYLAKHKAKEMKDKLPDAAYMTIDEVAKKAGKFTAGASANGYIRPSRGFGPQWDQYINHIEKEIGLKGVDIFEKGMAFITPKKDQPWFLYLGMIDTHVTWRAKQPWLDKYDPGYKGKHETQYGDDGKGGFGKGLSDKEKNHIRAIYDSNVSYQDDLVGKLIEKLQGWGIYDKTMIIITADHGDEQWEHDDRVGHAGSQRETVVHVPLLIHYPPMFPTAKIASGTEGVDIVPTIADVLGVPTDAEWQGASLLPLAHGANVYPNLAVSSAYENMHVGRMGDWKLQLKGGASPRLWNLAKDPDEKKDMFGSAAIPARLLLDPMWLHRSYNVEWKKSQWGNPASVSSRFAADLGE